MIRATALLLLLSALPAQAAERSGVLGEWATKGFGSVVEIAPCAGDPEAVCGRLVWLWDSVDSNGKPLVDHENSDPALRDRPLLGLEFLSGYKPKGDNVWGGGKIYNPEDGRTYTGTLCLKAPGVLELEGCALGLFCGSQVWRRPDEVLKRAGLRK